MRYLEDSQRKGVASLRKHEQLKRSANDEKVQHNSIGYIAQLHGYLGSAKDVDLELKVGGEKYVPGVKRYGTTVTTIAHESLLPTLLANVASLAFFLS